MPTDPMPTYSGNPSPNKRKAAACAEAKRQRAASPTAKAKRNKPERLAAKDAHQRHEQRRQAGKAGRMYGAFNDFHFGLLDELHDE